MKKILIFTDAFSGGGAEEVMNFYSDKLAGEYNVLHISKWSGPKKIILPNWKRTLNKKTSKQCIPDLYKIIKTFKPDLVLSATGHNNIIVLALKVLFFNKFKVIIRESSVASEMKKFSIKSRLLDLLLVKPLYKSANKIITQCEDMYADLLENYKLNPSKLIIINNPIINNPQFDGTLVKNNNKIVLLNIGRFSSEKGHFRLMEILKKLPENFFLKLMGDGLLKEEIISYAKKNQVYQRIEFLGFLDEEKKVEEIKRADIYVQTSFVEGFPNSLLQAISYGLPVIAFNVKGGTKEIINDKNGMLVNDNDFTGFVEKLKNTNWKSFDKDSMTEDINQRFGEETIIKKIKQLIENELK